jgi:hypothetical protein
MIDVNQLRSPVLAMNVLPNVDAAYTLHYDETNNIRRLHLTPGGLNVRAPQCFVLGGIAHRGPAPELQFETLRGVLRLQKSAHELKLEHLGKGDFLNLLEAPKVGSLLDWLIDQEVFAHYQVLDPLYWSIVDVIDSIIAEEGSVQLMMIAPMLKSDLYALLRDEIDHTAELLGRYDYPNVGRARRKAFLTELCDLLEARRATLPDFNYQMLKGLLQIGITLDTLPYLEGETPNVLIDGFGAFYLHRLALFKNANHILDIETTIETYLAGLDLADGDKPLQNFSFVDSRDEPWVQISDALAGLLGKFFSYMNRTPGVELLLARSGMSHRQRRTFVALTALLGRSIQECPAFAQYVVSAEDQRRRARMLGF